MLKNRTMLLIFLLMDTSYIVIDYSLIVIFQKLPCLENLFKMPERLFAFIEKWQTLFDFLLLYKSTHKIYAFLNENNFMNVSKKLQIVSICCILTLLDQIHPLRREPWGFVSYGLWNLKCTHLKRKR